LGNAAPLLLWVAAAATLLRCFGATLLWCCGLVALALLSRCVRCVDVVWLCGCVVVVRGIP